MLLTKAQLQSELERCEYCETKPCLEACPSNCSPADFIMAAKQGAPSDFQRAAGLILSHNPMGAVCGAVCPDYHCQAACVREGFDKPIEIPSIQETLVYEASKMGVTPKFEEAEDNGKRIAIIGAGPAGLVAAFSLAQLGYRVEIFEKMDVVGGSINLIPEHRLSKDIIQTDLDFVLASDKIKVNLGVDVTDLSTIEGFDGTIVTVGLTDPLKLGITGENKAIYGWDFLADPSSFNFDDGAVAVIGGGAVASDCAVSARRTGAKRVELFSLEKLSEMTLTRHERDELLEHGVQINGRTRVSEILLQDDSIQGIKTVRVNYLDGEMAFGEEPSPFNLAKVTEVAHSEQTWNEFKYVIIAIGHRSTLKAQEGVFFAGDCDLGPTTVVEAVAAGKNVAAEIDSYLSKKDYIVPDKKSKSTITINGYNDRPVSLETDFFGRKLSSPFLLSAAPPTDGYEQMKLAFEAGWAGGFMKTAFDGLDIHIPSEYMFAAGQRTWGNSDNVSGHSLTRVCSEIERLVAEFPDKLVAASTGGPVTGNDTEDALIWQSNTRKLEKAGVMAIEYSLSCPQGGDGTEGDIVSQSPSATAKIIDWILETGDPNVPKLFKLTGAVTSIAVIVNAVKEVLDRYPNAKAGVTLANTFPSVKFRPSADKKWDQAVVVGLSGEGITAISNMTLANVSNIDVPVSGNGGPMNYKAAANFLALGAKTVQFCTIAMVYGYDIIDELKSGLSHLMAERQINSVDELIGIALPNPITDFMDLTPVKKVSDVDPELCISCGNCLHCSYLAITMNDDGIPVTNPEYCVGCSICVQKCISGALFMRERTPHELEILKED